MAWCSSSMTATKWRPSFDVTVNDGSGRLEHADGDDQLHAGERCPGARPAHRSPYPKARPVTLGAGSFGVTDPDSASFTYTVSSVSGGCFQLSSAPRHADHEFHERRSDWWPGAVRR